MVIHCHGYDCGIREEIFDEVWDEGDNFVENLIILERNAAFGFDEVSDEEESNEDINFIENLNILERNGGFVFDEVSDEDESNEFNFVENLNVIENNGSFGYEVLDEDESNELNFVENLNIKINGSFEFDELSDEDKSKEFNSVENLDVGKIGSFGFDELSDEDESKEFNFVENLNFIGKTGRFYQEKNLHTNYRIHMVGKLLYSKNFMFVEDLHSNKKLFIKSDSGSLWEVNLDGNCYVHIYGILSFWKNYLNGDFYNFNDENDLSYVVVEPVLNEIKFTLLNNVHQAQKYYKIFKDSNPNHFD